MSETIYKLEPHRTMYLRGFDRRGCAASLNNASESGFTVSGVFSDQADFAVLVLFDTDDQFGHLFTTKYLPDFSLTGVTQRISAGRAAGDESKETIRGRSAYSSPLEGRSRL